MKKILLSLFLLFGAFGVLRATDSELIPDRNGLVAYNFSFPASVFNATSTLVIDLSDTSTWPHEETRAIKISAIRTTIDKVAAATVTLKIGVVNFVDTSTGSVTWFHIRNATQNVSNTDSERYVNYQPSYVRARVNHTAVTGNGLKSDGTTPYILSNDKAEGSTLYQLDVPLVNPSSSLVAPAEGDIVCEITKSLHTIHFGIEILYHAVSR